MSTTKESIAPYVSALTEQTDELADAARATAIVMKGLAQDGNLTPYLLKVLSHNAEHFVNDVERVRLSIAI